MMSMVMKRDADVGREVSELWLATMFIGGIVLLSGVLHCCVFGGDGHPRGAPLCVQFADALAETNGEHSTTTPPRPTRSETVVASPVSVPLYPHDRLSVGNLTVARGPCTRRNAMALGAMRIDDDVGVHDLNATYLI